MSDAVVAEIATRWHLADPPPSHCSGCFRSSDPTVRFYTPDAAIDRGVFVDANGAQAVLDSMDWLYLCASVDADGSVVGGCVKELCELSAFNPQLHARQLLELRRQALEIEDLKRYAKRLEGTLQDRPDSLRRGRGNR
jgi:hypothetical protein